MRLRRPDLRVESFEYVEVAPGLTLLRLSGEWRGRAPDGVRLVGAGEELGALPEPPPADGDPLWRAAFSAPGEVLGGPFVLDTHDGRSVDLPLPVAAALPGAVVEEEDEADPDPYEEDRYEDTHAEATPDIEPLCEPETDPFEYAQPEADPHAEAPPAADQSLHEALAAAERKIQIERGRHERAEASLREQLRVMVVETADFMGRLEGYELRRAELEKELSWERLLHKETQRLREAAEEERDEATARLEPVEEELGRLRRELEASARAQRNLAEARERNAELERRLERQEELLEGARAVVERGGVRLDDLEERLIRLRDAAAGVQVGQDGRALVATPEQVEAVERALEEADRGSERLAQLERRVGELREGIARESAAPDGDRPSRRFLR